jgi:hypothetical protein
LLPDADLPACVKFRITIKDNTFLDTFFLSSVEDSGGQNFEAFSQTCFDIIHFLLNLLVCQFCFTFVVSLFDKFQQSGKINALNVNLFVKHAYLIISLILHLRNVLKTGVIQI